MTRPAQTHEPALLAPRPQALTEGLQRESWLRYWTDLRHWTASPTTEEGLCNSALLAAWFDLHETSVVLPASCLGAGAFPYRATDQHGLVLTGLTSHQTRAFANITEATNELLAYAPSIQYRGLRYGHPLWRVNMQGTLKGIRICHGDPVYIKHQGRVAGGLVGSLSGNCDYSVRLRVTGVWTDTNVGVHRTSRGYFYLEFPRERVRPGPRVSGIARWIMSGSPPATDPGFAEWLMAWIILPPV
jgi:hypothetical protein